MLNEKILRTLKVLGIPASLRGYAYIHDAISMALEKPSVVYSITSDVYPAIAKMHDTTPSAVERCIRHAIEHAFSEANSDILYNVFANTISKRSGKVPNCIFIATVAEVIRTNQDIEGKQTK